MRAAILALILAVPRAPLTAQQARAIQAPPAAPAPGSAGEQTKPATAPSSTIVETTDSARSPLSETAVDSLRALVAQVRHLAQIEFRRFGVDRPEMDERRPTLYSSANCVIVFVFWD